MKKLYLFVACMSFLMGSCGQETQLDHNTSGPEKEMIDVTNKKAGIKMKVEIWSDVMCPFCYIGKRKFEMALEQFSGKEHIEIEWKSFQLMPELKAIPGKSINDILSETKGMSPGQAAAMNEQVTQVAKKVGLEYHLDKSIPANTFNAHRFTHFAKANGKQIEAEEALFRAYFTEGKNIDDYPTLLRLGKEIGLDEAGLKAALEGGSYADEVKQDIYEAQQIGVRGVPFFVFDRKQAISGAQEPSTFLQVLETTFSEWRKNNPETKLNVIDGQSCTPEGECN